MASLVFSADAALSWQPSGGGKPSLALSLCQFYFFALTFSSFPPARHLHLPKLPAAENVSNKRHFPTGALGCFRLFLFQVSLIGGTNGSSTWPSSLKFPQRPAAKRDCMPPLGIPWHQGFYLWRNALCLHILLPCITSHSWGGPSVPLG